MNRDVVIEAHNVGKSYRDVSTRRIRRLGALREVFTRRRTWVLHDVSLTVHRGESLALIGQNGCGKSTMLRLMAGLTRPSRGTISVHEPVSGLLAIGEGFEGELSGEENAITAALLAGLTRRQARSMLDDIAAFAELEDHMDQPLRTYSSGMRSRLAFSASILINPTVLLVDELLAVGDIRFRERCLHRLEELQAQGVTIVLTSHEMGQVERLCSRAAWIRDGRLILVGDTEEVAGRYRQAMTEGLPDPIRLDNGGLRLGTREVEVVHTRLLSDGLPVTQLRSGDPLDVEIAWKAHTAVPHPIFGVSIHTDGGARLMDLNSAPRAGHTAPDGVARLHIERLDLADGEYLFDVGIYADDWNRPYDYLWRAVPLTVFGREAPTGTMAPPHQWS